MRVCRMGIYGVDCFFDDEKYDINLFDKLMLMAYWVYINIYIFIHRFRAYHRQSNLVCACWLYECRSISSARRINKWMNLNISHFFSQHTHVSVYAALWKETAASDDYHLNQAPEKWKYMFGHHHRHHHRRQFLFLLLWNWASHGSYTCTCTEPFQHNWYKHWKAMLIPCFRLSHHFCSTKRSEKKKWKQNTFVRAQEQHILQNNKLLIKLWSDKHSNNIRKHHWKEGNTIKIRVREKEKRYIAHIK